MAHINVPEGVPGIRSLVLFRPETGQYLYELAQVLLRGPSPLTEAQRELIAAFVSHHNNCVFCASSHAAAAKCLYGEQHDLVDAVMDNADDAPLDDKMKALLRIAEKVRVLGKEVTSANIHAARSLGANDREIHDTVLIAATFSMFNRYVDGLAAMTPTDSSVYMEMGKRITKVGYVLPNDDK